MFKTIGYRICKLHSRLLKSSEIFSVIFLNVNELQKIQNFLFYLLKYLLQEMFIFIDLCILLGLD